MKDEYKIIVTTPKDKKALVQCNNISLQHNFMNGGQLMFHAEDLWPAFEKLVCVVDKKNNIIGYCGLRKNFILDNDIYIAQIAVDKRHAHEGIGSAMVEYVKNHFKNYSFVSAEIKNTNAYSLATFQKEGFKLLNKSQHYSVYIFKNKNYFSDFDDLEI